MASLSIESLIIKQQDQILVNLSPNNTIKIQHSLGLVGQSGSGKSLTLKAILGMLPANLQAEFQYSSDFELTKKNISFIPQNPFTSLSPMTKISKQFFQPQNIIDEYFELVGLETKLQHMFPVQLSGGQLQRIVIAIALSTQPKLLLLDEPTTALDFDNKQNILQLIQSLQKKLNFLTIFVSHDIISVESTCEKIAIMNKGKIVEYGDTQNILHNPNEDYTKTLIQSNFSNREFRV
jgi:peptide/nickel transport system ATP-binding protein